MFKKEITIAKVPMRGQGEIRSMMPGFISCVGYKFTVACRVSCSKI